MTNLGVVFLTGLTTGGLSCLAVQGGLLAGSVARQAEKDIRHHLDVRSAVRSGGKRRQGPTTPATHPGGTARPAHHIAGPIAAFLGAKLVAYTALGFLLGWLGSFLQLTPTLRALLQVAIGAFMVGTALRLFNVHPIFRCFVLEPPAFVTRSLRRLAKDGTHDVATPIFLGALTVLIPCGVTQAMMALAVGAGNPLLGAAIMFAFTLGTSPLFFALFYLATRLGTAMEARFLKVAAVAVLVLGILSIDGGLNLLGSPLSLATLADAPPFARAAPPQPTVAVAGAPAAGGGSAEGAVTIQALDYGYAPTTARAEAGRPVTLRVVTSNTSGCTRAFVIPSLRLQRLLPETGTTTIDLPPQPAGTLRFTCSMGMYRGQIQFE
jgi:uncharacterized protein